MAGLQGFVVQFGTEKGCIEHLAALRWPGGFACAGWGGRAAWRLRRGRGCTNAAACHRPDRRLPEPHFIGHRRISPSGFSPPI